MSLPSERQPILSRFLFRMRAIRQSLNVGAALFCLAAIAAPADAAIYSWNQGSDVWDNVGLKWNPLLAGPPTDGDSAILGDLLVAADAEVTLGLNMPALAQLDVTGGVDLLTAGFNGEAATVNISGVDSTLIVQSGTFFDNHDNGTTVAASGQLVVESGGLYGGGEIAVEGGGDIRMQGGTLQIRRNNGNGFLDIEAGSEVSGWGTIEFRDNGVLSTLLINDGTIATSRPFPDFGLRQTLTIDVTDSGESASLVDLDGTAGLGTVTLANTTTLEILGTLTDAYSSTIEMNAGSILHISQPWELGSGAVVDVDAIQFLPVVPSTFARINGGEVVMAGGSTVDVQSGTLQFDADLVAQAGSQINVMDNATLQLGGVATIQDTETIDLRSDSPTLRVTGNTTIVDLSGGFDWDGLGGSSSYATTVVEEGATLSIDVEEFDAGAAEPLRYDGELSILGGVVDVRVDNNDATVWTMDRTLNLTNTNGTPAVLTGNRVKLGNDDGTSDARLNVDGAGLSEIVADVQFNNDAAADIAAGATLAVQGDVRYQGGVYTGSGTYLPGANNTVIGPTDIGATTPFTLNIDLDSGAWLIEAGSQLTIHAASIDPVDNDFDNDLTLGAAASLEVQMPADSAWTIDDARVVLEDAAILRGDPIVFTDQSTLEVNHDATLDVRVDLGGAVDTSTLTQLELLGGSTFAPNRLSGGSIAGLGTVTLVSTGLVGYGDIEASIEGGSGTEVRADDGVLNLLGEVPAVGTLGTADGDGVLNLVNPLSAGAGDIVELLGGRFIAPSVTFEQASFLLLPDADVGVIEASNIRFEGGSAVSLGSAGSQLRLEGDSWIDRQANLTGLGTLVNSAGAQMTIDSDAMLDVGLRNAGSIELGVSIGQVNTRRFSQTENGILEIDVAGLIPGSGHDYLVVDGGTAATLDGTLTVHLSGGHVPAIGDAYDIISAVGGIAGTFAEEQLPTLAPLSIWEVVYEANRVSLEVVNGVTTDFDVDGVSGGSDFLTWQRGYPDGTTAAEGDGDGDGDVDRDDLLRWQAEFGHEAALPAAFLARPNLASVPEPSSLALLAIGCSMLLRLRATQRTGPCRL